MKRWPHTCLDEGWNDDSKYFISVSLLNLSMAPSSNDIMLCDGRMYDRGHRLKSSQKSEVLIYRSPRKVSLTPIKSSEPVILWNTLIDRA